MLVGLRREAKESDVPKEIAAHRKENVAAMATDVLPKASAETVIVVPPKENVAVMASGVRMPSVQKVGRRVQKLATGIGDVTTTKKKKPDVLLR